MAALDRGVRNQCQAVEESPFARVSWTMGRRTVRLCIPEDDVFTFDPTALAAIKYGAGLLRRGVSGSAPEA
jgi:hypothetical protein